MRVFKKNTMLAVLLVEVKVKASISLKVTFIITVK
jgi:hypothetical protein